ncbi:hypothetical protein [Kitasatospora sp. A2-31]|uniref:hypothetical protein n=1 Tax=Kitasatospora sp. A2-31 TaxID=2916414 RepID=UPI001EEB777D|nr:hypothetical protein [Kitasatospora sp. A2-31]MCG6497110.1 hypothetical protein [Kitasatospora sp. A2-31]
MDVQSLWWRAGRLAYDMPAAGWLEQRWHDSVRRAATLLQPTSTPEGYSSGPWTYALPTVALLVYTARDRDPDRDPDREEASWPKPLDGVTAEWIIEQVADRTGLPGRVRAGLERYNQLVDGNPIGRLFAELTDDHEPVRSTASGTELPSLEQFPGGTLLVTGAEWAEGLLTRHYLSTIA